MRVREPAQRTAQAVPMVDVRAVRVAEAVGEGVVLAVVGDPRDHGSLDRYRSEDREQPADVAVRLERAVRQQPVEADGDAEPVARYMIPNTIRSL